MNKKDLDKLVRWAVDVTPMKFAEDAYGITGTAYDRTDDYIRGKYSMMHENFIMWLGGLDAKNRVRLSNHITFSSSNAWEDETEKPKDVDVVNLNEHKEKYKAFYKDINNIVGDMVAVGSKNKRKGE